MATSKTTPLDAFLLACSEEISRRAALDAPARDQKHQTKLVAGASAFSEALRNAPPLSYERTDVPLSRLLADLSPTPLVSTLLAARDELTWIASPRTNDGGEQCALSPINDARNLGDVTCGLMFIDADCVYPEHGHPPNEIYLPIAGDGQWRYGGESDYRTLGPDTLVYNPPRAIHSTKAGHDPLLALYVLWS